MEKTMISCGLKGGLGNILFQVATTYSLALDNNDECYFDLWHHSNSPRLQKPALDYKNNFLKNIKDLRRMPHSSCYSYDSLVYKPIPYSSGILLDGFFQSEKYFKHRRNEILSIFRMSEDQKSQILSKYPGINNSVSIHVRRGDFLHFSNVYHLCEQQYYRNAIERFPNKNFLIFSDDKNWCKQVFKGNNFKIVENEPDYVELYMLGQCSDNIIANSSFSWWGAWLNENPHKIVISPKNWIKTQNCEDIYCENWIKV